MKLPPQYQMPFRMWKVSRIMIWWFLYLARSAAVLEVTLWARSKVFTNAHLNNVSRAGLEWAILILEYTFLVWFLLVDPCEMYLARRLRGQPHPDPASHTAEVHPSYNSHPVPLAEHNTSAGHITDQATPPTMLSATGGLGEMKKKGRSASYPPSLALQINTPNISPRQVFSGGTDECLPTSIYTWAEALHRDTRLRSPPLLGFNATRSRPDEEIKARLANITELMQSMQSSHEAYMANSIRIIFEMEAMALQKVQDIKQARGEGDGGVDIDGLGTSVDPVAMAPSDS